MRATEVELQLPYQFTSVELLQLGKQLAEIRFTIEQTENDKKAAMEEFADQLKQQAAELYRLARLVKNGFELRPTMCEIHYCDPHVGEKSIYRKDDGELVKTIPMTEEERQEEIPLMRGSGEVAPAPANAIAITEDNDAPYAEG